MLLVFLSSVIVLLVVTRRLRNNQLVRASGLTFPLVSSVCMFVGFFFWVNNTFHCFVLRFRFVFLISTSRLPNRAFSCMPRLCAFWIGFDKWFYFLLRRFIWVWPSMTLSFFFMFRVYMELSPSLSYKLLKNKNVWHQ